MSTGMQYNMQASTTTSTASKLVHTFEGEHRY